MREWECGTISSRKGKARKEEREKGKKKEDDENQRLIYINFECHEIGINGTVSSFFEFSPGFFFFFFFFLKKKSCRGNKKQKKNMENITNENN